MATAAKVMKRLAAGLPAGVRRADTATLRLPEDPVAIEESGALGVGPS